MWCNMVESKVLPAMPLVKLAVATSKSVIPRGREAGREGDLGLGLGGRDKRK